MAVLLVVIYIVFISLGLPDSLFGVSWPVVHVDFGIDESFASLYSVITAFCTGGISFIAGPLIRKFGTGKVTFCSILLTSLGLVGISFSPNIVVMMLCAVIMGYGAGAIDTGLNNYVSLHYEARHMNWLHCFWGVGVTLSPVIMSAFLGTESGSWRNGYRVIALLQFGIAMLVLMTLKRWNAKPKEINSREETETEKPKKGFFALIKTKGVLTSILSLGFYCAGEFMIGTWGATYAVNVFALSPDEAAKWISLFFGGIMLGRVVAGFVSMKLADNTLVKVGMAFAALGILILVLPIGKNALLGLLLIGFGYGPVFPSILHNIPSRFGTQYSADLTGFHMSGAYGIGFFVQLLFGYFAAATTFAVTPYVLFVLCAGVFAMQFITLKLLKKASLAITEQEAWIANSES